MRRVHQCLIGVRSSKVLTVILLIFTVCIVDINNTTEIQAEPPEAINLLKLLEKPSHRMSSFKKEK